MIKRERSRVMKMILVKFMILALYRIMSVPVDEEGGSAVSLKYRHSSSSEELQLFKTWVTSKLTLKASLLQGRRSGISSLCLGKQAQESLMAEWA